MKTITITRGKRDYRLQREYDLSIPLNFHGPQPNAYGVWAATAEPFRGVGFVLDTRQGGSCNCETITFTPHCNGTHTECAGHLTKKRFSVAGPPGFLAATLISVELVGRLITADAIEIVKYNPQFLEALVVRTLPNSTRKKTRAWSDETTPYFTPQAMEAIRSLGVEHLLVDLPSLDPLSDGGKLAAHRVFWDMPAGSKDMPQKAIGRTVTEMIFVPDEVPDGRYFLSLQIPNFGSDAAPSRPILHEIEDES